MELLQKIKLSNTVVNGRYSLNDNLKDSTYWFTVLEIDDHRIKIQYSDKAIGILYKDTTFNVGVFNFPFSSLEKELL
jgi:hypothetical protein